MQKRLTECSVYWELMIAPLSLLTTMRRDGKVLTGSVNLTLPIHMATKMCLSVKIRPQYCYLRVYSYLLPGEYDAGLKWPFRGAVVVQLLNQLSDDNHYDYVFDYSEASDGESQRVTGEQQSSCKCHASAPDLPLIALEYDSSKKCQYLKNDCLIFKIVVKKL